MGQGVRREVKWGRETARATLLSSILASEEGPWVLVDAIRPWSVCIEGNFDGTVKLRVSNAGANAEPTLARTQYAQLDQDILGTPKVLKYDTPFIWIAAEIAGNTGGLRVQVDLLGG